MEVVLAAAVAAVAPTIIALATYRNSKIIKTQTNSMLHDPLERIETAVLDTQVRLTRVENVVIKHLDFHKTN